MYVYAYIYIYIHIYIHVYVYIYACVYIYIYMAPVASTFALGDVRGHWGTNDPTPSLDETRIFVLLRGALPA